MLRTVEKAKHYIQSGLVSKFHFIFFKHVMSTKYAVRDILGEKKNKNKKN